MTKIDWLAAGAIQHQAIVRINRKKYKNIFFQSGGHLQKNEKPAV
jgi:hypothetical protein